VVVPPSKPFGPRRWHRIGGTADAFVFPITGKPSITNSNAFVLKTPRTVVVIDPGADHGQAALVSDLVREARSERKRAFLLFLTHAHLDHFLNVGRIVETCGRPVSFVHAAAAAAIALRDPDHTLAILYKDARLPAWTPDIAMFSAAEPGVIAAGDGGRTWTLLQRGEPDWLCLALELDPGNTLEIYPTPGHSPCSCSIRLGGFMAIGDLPFAAKPGLAGLAGWSAPALETSLRNVSRLLARGDVAVCGLGHGDCAPAGEVARSLDGVRRRLGGLGAIAMLDERRIAELRRFALELLTEGRRLFAILGGRLLYVSHVLEHLEEAGEAARVSGMLDGEAIERVLHDLDAFCLAFEAGEHPELSVVLKAAAAVERLQMLVSGAPALRALSVSLFGRVEQLLGHFGQTVQGLTFSVEPERVDVLAIVRSAVDDERKAARNDAALLAAVDDSDAFAAAMARRIASHSVLSTAPIDVVQGSRGALTGEVGVGIFRNLLVTLLEAAAADARTGRIAVTVSRDAGEVAVGIRSDDGSTPASITAWQASLYRRMMAEMGGDFRVDDRSLELRVPARD
jgi:glyoxylase-like metal-dependent hydrolase (beta-lactamase superfamily II)